MVAVTTSLFAQERPSGGPTAAIPALIRDMTGTWSVEQRMWTGPGAGPAVLPSAIARRRLLEGGFLEEVMEKSPRVQGDTFTRIAYLNFNAVTQRFEYISLDSRAQLMVERSRGPGSWWRSRLRSNACAVRRGHLRGAAVGRREERRIQVPLDHWRQDATLELPPSSTWFAGAAAVARAVSALGSPGDWRMLPTAADGQQAAAAYRRSDGAYRHTQSLFLPRPQRGLQGSSSSATPVCSPSSASRRSYQRLSWSSRPTEQGWGWPGPDW
jgi:hypothetical protein